MALLAAMTAFFGQAENPKREFRGAWLHTVHQSQYARMTPQQTQEYLRGQLDRLRDAGCNVVIFQVRPSADALYPSDLEPWSRFLTGVAGQAPSPMWDPLQFMIEEAHARGMELHAWLNPYRVTTSKNETLPEGHIGRTHPERIVTYADGKKYFDPGLPENRTFIVSVIKDIISRYDVDAIHLDDYFYPYPVNRRQFPDSKSYKKYGNGMDRDDWRRENVNLLIKDIHEMIVATKPWVRLGISPFGIWRNKTSDPDGSDTNGLQNYDELYADVTLWSENGWIDYMTPQLYWELEKKVASSEKLAYWWNDHANGRDMYIGQDVKRTMDTPDIRPSDNPTQLDHKIRLTRELPNIGGNCWWPGYMITDNYKGIADSLATNRQSTVAIVPAYTWIDSICPDEAESLRRIDNRLVWKAPITDDPLQQAQAFVVYRFPADSRPDLNTAVAIQCVTRETSYNLPTDETGSYVYVVTVLDRVNNESPNGAAIKIDFP